jgi:glycine/D-amino acid oxidase-like deaminating enzyme/nitrite reductase/ring-hydroxylating ferredoxin subunit
MTMQSERTQSLWQSNESGGALSRPGFNGELSADIVVIGAGIAGLSIAYQLAVDGRPVVVIDDGDIGGGNTGRTTAHLSNVLDDRFVNLRRERGKDIARIAAESHGAAVDWIERVQRDEGIDCGFRRLDGYLLLGEGDEEELLDEELEAAIEAGLTVEKLARAPAGLPAVPALKFSHQARFDPLAYLAGLAKAVEKRGGRIFSGCHVTGVKDGNPVSIALTGGGRITARKAIVATATPINDRLTLHTKLAPYRTYAIAAPIDTGAIPDVLAWDTSDPYHYVRLAEHGDGTFVILGGEDHKTGQSDEPTALARLEAWAVANYSIGRAAFAWSGQVMETLDGLAYIGLNPGERNIFVAVGDSGMGMTHGTIAAMMLSAIIDGGDHPWQAAYDPSRKPIGTAATFVSETVNVAKQMVDFVTPSDVASMADIAVGEGAVLRHGLSKIAVYRDERGKLHVRSAVCPHLGCIVHWNGLEKVWDCPCHGSQFDGTGRVLHGPAVDALPTVGDFDGDKNPNLDVRNASGA